jgi:hypothetical protein
MGEGCYRPQTCIREAAYADCRVTWRALTHIRDTHVPVEEPSTASISVSCTAAIGDPLHHQGRGKINRARASCSLMMSLL